MTQKSITLKVEPAVMQWAVESSGWKHDDLARTLKVSKNTFNAWLQGTTQPTITQVQSLANTIKRPLAAFLLETPPQEKPAPKDYRMLPGKEGEFNKKTLLAIRRARRLQKISKELAENLQMKANLLVAEMTVNNNSVTTAAEYRNSIGLTEEKQARCKTPYELFNFLRDCIEDRGILVFQISMPIEDARGFAIVDDGSPVIVVSSKDSIEARIFTLMHEFGHVLLRESGIDIPEHTLSRTANSIEKWCNDFAAAFLLPEATAKLLFSQNKDSLTKTETLDKLSRRYKVSKNMLLYNMMKLHFISQDAYQEIIERYKLRTEKKKQTGKGFSASGDKRCISENGQRFVALVLNNMERGFITRSDALNYLSIKSKNLEKVMTKAKK